MAAGASSLVTGETGDSVTLWERLLAEKDARIADLQAERDRLLRLLEDLQARLPALPPSSSLNITRWQALKIALLGRS
jgi:Tfp pilus assembly protein PilN